MFDLRFPINLPNFDLTTVLAIAVGLLTVVLILAALLVRSALRSRLVLVIAFGLIVTGALSNLGAVTGLIAIAGVIVIGVIITLGRNKDVLDLIRALVKPNDAPTFVGRSATVVPPTIVDQPPARLNAPVTVARLKSRRQPGRNWSKWGF
jgi:hypothetical protein